MSVDLVEIAKSKRCLVSALLAESYRKEWILAELRREFAKKDYVRLPGLLSQPAFHLIQAEVDRLESFAKKKDFVMPESKTPRIMKPLGGQVILRESDVLPSLYCHHEIRNLVSGIVGSPIYTCLHEIEYMVVNYQVSAGDTQGFHLDDPAYALIICTDSPNHDQGGLLEYIRDWPDICEATNVSVQGGVDLALVERCRKSGLVQVKHHAPGDAYLLRADKCLHRVTPLSSHGVRRAVINMAFEATPVTLYGESANVLYAEL